jgi:hypothetical protein
LEEVTGDKSSMDGGASGSDAGEATVAAKIRTRS